MKNNIKDNIILHHIGSRSGTRSFPSNLKFESEMINILYEADEECIQQIKQVNEALSSKLIIYPNCISDKVEEVEFNICYDPNLSSFFSPINLKYDYYYFNGVYDYNFRETSKIIKKIKLKTTTLDNILLKEGDKFLLPDFLSLDTQGSELKIINGSPNCIKNALAIIVEVSFVEFYKDQPRFDTIIKSMQDKGFDFIRFTNSIEQLSLNYPIGLRSRGRFTDGDALFIRPLSSLENLERKNLSSYYKLAYTYISFEMLEHALECIDEIKKNWGLSEEKNYYSFLNKIYQLSKEYKIYPKKFSDLYTKELSLSRFITKSKGSKLKLILKSIKPLKKTFKNIFKFYNKSKETFIKIFLYIGIINELKKNELERLLEKNDFKNLSNTIYKNRVSFYKKKLGLYKLEKNIKKLS